jgi:hypothetical protein
MTTSSRRAFVSIVATIAITLALGACVHAPSHSVPELIATDPGQPSIRFDNLGLERVDVYLIGGKREWLLGRVEPGATASLRIPEEAFADGSKFVRLAVLANEERTFQAARNPRAKLTIALPPSEILSQRWSFSQGQLTFLRH